MSEPMHVAYLLKQYPRLSETFILSEILGLEEHGVKVSVHSLRHATEGRFHPLVAAVRGEVHYAADATKAAFLDALRALPDLGSDRLTAALTFVDRLPEDRRARLLLQAIDVAEKCIQSEVDHLHAHFLTVASHTAHLVHLLTGIPYTVTAHAKDIYRHTVDWDIAARVAGHAAAVITVCDANVRFLTPRLDGSGARIERVYNGLAPQSPPVSAGERPSNVVLGVGRLVEKKGFDVLLAAVAQLRTSHPDLQCVLVGDGDRRSSLEALASDLGISHAVTFTGALPQPAVADWLRRSTVLALPCRVGTDGNQDALPTVLLEGLAAGIPAVATDVAGVPEIISDGIEGLVIRECDPTDLAAALDRILSSTPLREAMSAAGPAKLAERFDRGRTISELLAAFRPIAMVAGR